MKALSLWQPWASYVAQRHKIYETRSWSTSYRGLLAIHAPKRWTDEEKRQAEAIHHRFPAISYIENPPLGVMLCVCRLLNCIRTETLTGLSAHERAVGNFSEGRFAWELEVLEVFPESIPAKGAQGIFDWEIPKPLLENRVAIVGSRDYNDLEAVKRYVYSLPKTTTIVSGGARGVDTAAADAAKTRGMNVVVIPVNQRGLPDDHHRNEVFARRAMQRNGEIVEMAGTVVGFWDMSSRGTKDTLDKAEKAGKTVLINPNTVAPEAAAKQMKLEGFSNTTYNESAYIEALEKAKAFSSEGEKGKPIEYQWEWPWLATKTDVWGKDEGGGYKLIPKDSKEAAAWGRILSGWLYSSETLNLREWLKKQRNNFIPLPCDYVDLNRYAVDDVLHAVKESDIQYRVIPVEKLTFTQETYNPGICLKYLEAGTIKEFDSNTLPMVYQFKGDERYFITNGSHRGIAWLMGLDPKHRAAMPVRFCYIPHSLESLYERAVEVDENDDEHLEFLADVLTEAIQIIQEGKLVPA